MGGTLRLGLYPSKLKRGSKAAAAYDNQEVVQRRHRHRYEFNNAFREQFEEAGFVFSGVSPDNRLVEIVEIPENKFFVACLPIPPRIVKAVQTVQKDFTQPLSQRQLKTTIANKNQGRAKGISNVEQDEGPCSDEIFLTNYRFLSSPFVRK